MTFALVLLRAFTMGCWLVAGASMARATARVLIRRAHGLYDPIWAVLFFAAAVNIGFNLRWFVWTNAISYMAPHELAAWAILYLASSGVALGLVLVRRSYDPGV